MQMENQSALLISIMAPTDFITSWLWMEINCYTSDFFAIRKNYRLALWTFLV